MRKGIQIIVLTVIVFLLSSLPFYSKTYPAARIWFRDPAESQPQEWYSYEVTDTSYKQAVARVLYPDAHQFHAAEHALDYSMLPSIRIEYTDGTSISFGINATFFRTVHGNPQGTWFITPEEYEILQSYQVHSTQLATPYQP